MSHADPRGPAHASPEPSVLGGLAERFCRRAQGRPKWSCREGMGRGGGSRGRAPPLQTLPGLYPPPAPVGAPLPFEKLSLRGLEGSGGGALAPAPSVSQGLPWASVFSSEKWGRPQPSARRSGGQLRPQQGCCQHVRVLGPAIPPSLERAEPHGWAAPRAPAGLAWPHRLSPSRVGWCKPGSRATFLAHP